MKPFELQLELLSPVILPTWPVHLDGLIWWALSHHLPTEEILPAMATLLDVHEGVFKASAMTFVATPWQTLTAATVSYVDAHRWQESDLLAGCGKKTITLAGGPYMRRLREWQAYQAPALRFTGVGEADQILTLLKNTVFGIGRNHRHGAGRVGRMGWQEIESDESWHDAQQKLQRSLPIALSQDNDAITGQAVIVPPYHLNSPTLCRIPEAVRRVVREHLIF